MIKKIMLVLAFLPVAAQVNSNAGDNPIQIAGACLSPQKVAITFANYGTVTAPSPFVNVDSVGLWYKTGTMPVALSGATFLKGYLLSALRSRSATYTDTLTVPPLAGGDSVYGFMNEIFWSDKSISAFNAGNGTLVLMKDTMSIINPLILAGAYFPNDTARVYLYNISQIDTSRVDSAVVWYGLASAIPDFSDKNAVFRLSAKAVAASSQRYALSIINPLFNGAQRTLHAAAVLIGKNGKLSPVVSVSFLVGKLRPLNPLILAAKVISSSTIRLTWNNVAGYGIERMVIWYRPFQPVPLVYDVSALSLDSLVPSITDTTIVASRFLEGARYYFGAQVYKGGLWSYITDSASANDSTPLACCGPVQPDSIPFLIRYNGGAIAVSRPHFTWHPVSNAVDYKIEIADNVGFTNATSLKVSDTSFVPLADLADGMWYWRVSCKRNYALFAPVDSVKVGASRVVGRAVPAEPFISLTKSNLGYRISFGGYDKGEVSAAVYSINGKRVSEFTNSAYSQGNLFWNYSDLHGSRVVNGLYLIEIKTGAKLIKQKVPVTR